MERAGLRLAIRQRADMVNSQFVTDDEINLMIDSSVAALHDILCTQHGDEYWAKISWINVFPGTDPNIAWPRPWLDNSSTPPDQGYASCYALPDDFMRLVRCQFMDGAFTWDAVRIGSESDFRNDKNPNVHLASVGKSAYPMHRLDTAGQVVSMVPADWKQTQVAYRLRRGPIRDLSWTSSGGGGTKYYTEITKTGTVIEFLPVPLRSYAVQVTYVPTAQLLPDHPFPEYLIFDCAALCLEKQGSDSSTLRALQGRVEQRIARESRTVDAANPPKVVDVYGRNRLPWAGNDYPPWR